MNPLELPQKDQKLIEEIFELLKMGGLPMAIYQHMLLDYPSLREGRFKELLEQAYRYAEVVLQKDREYLFMLHVNRYEELYKSCRELLDYSKRPLDPEKHRDVMVQKLRGAMRALKSKEDLLGLHDKKMVLELVDNQAFVLEQAEDSHSAGGMVAGIDLGKLDNEELAELLRLTQAARLTPLEGIQRVIIKQSKVTITAEGTPIVVEEATVIDDVKVISEFAEDLPDDVLAKLEALTRPDKEDLDDPNFIDDTKKLRELPQRTAEDLTQKLHKQHQEQHNKQQALERLRTLSKK